MNLVSALKSFAWGLATILCLNTALAGDQCLAKFYDHNSTSKVSLDVEKVKPASGITTVALPRISHALTDNESFTEADQSYAWHYKDGILHVKQRHKEAVVYMTDTFVQIGPNLDTPTRFEQSTYLLGPEFLGSPIVAEVERFECESVKLKP